MCRTTGRDEITISGINLLPEEHVLPPVAALRHMVRNIRNHNSCKAGHALTMQREPASVNSVSCRLIDFTREPLAMVVSAVTDWRWRRWYPSRMIAVRRVGAADVSDVPDVVDATTL